MTPQDKPANTKSDAEKKLYWHLKNELDDSFHIFHSRWIIFPEKYGPEIGEADFIIIHQDLGILILEVKGGKVSYDPIHDRWYQNNNPMKESPFKQANDNMWKILQYLKINSKFIKSKFVNLGYAVAFPDIDYIQGKLPPNADYSIVLLRKNIEEISSWILSAYKYWKGRKNRDSLELDGIDEIYKLFAPKNEFVKLLVNDLHEEKKIIQKLTEDQIKVLEYIKHSRQVKITGCAGSGKTQLAIEKVRQLCKSKLKTLLMCSSVELSAYCNLSLKEELNSGYCSVSYLSEFLSNLHNLHVEYQGDFDAIIIDEGQDFLEEDLFWIKKLLSNPEKGLLYIFLDSNQKITNHLSRVDIPSVISLNENLRNTNKIFEHFSEYLQTFEEITPSGITGRDVVLKEVDNFSTLKNILSLDINCLVEKEKIKLKDIVILTTKDAHQSFLGKIQKIGSYKLKKFSVFNYDPNSLSWSTCLNFKGLESPVIILIQEDKPGIIATNREIASMYVGASRAQLHLIVYSNGTVDKRLEEILS